MSKQKLIIALVLLVNIALVGGIGYIIWTKASPVLPKAAQSSRENTAETSPLPERQSTPAPEDAGAELSQVDKDTYQLYHYDLSIAVIGGYRIRHGQYPESTPAGWQKLLVWYEAAAKKPLIDPRTKKPLVFTTTTPGVGEVQYLMPGTCKTDRPELVSDTSPGLFAYRMTIRGELTCYSNIGGLVK